MRVELQEIVDQASRTLNTDVTLEDREFTLVTFGSQRLDVDSVRQWSILTRRSTPEIREWFEGFGISTSAGPLRTPADDARGIRTRLCFPARWRGVTYGYLWALDEVAELGSHEVEAVAQLAEHAGAHLAQLDRANRDDAAAVSDLLAVDIDAVRRSASRTADRGLFPRNRMVAAVVVGDLTPDARPVPVNFWGLPRHILADRGRSTTTLLVPLPDDGSLAPAREAAHLALKLYAEELGDRATEGLAAGIGDPRPDIAEVRDSWLEARLAARVAASVGSAGSVRVWADLGAYRLLATAPDADLARAVLDAPVRRLLAEEDTTLARTVLAYLENAGHVQQTATALHVHRQTLYGRLARVETLTGLDLSDGSVRLRLHLGLMLAPLLLAPPPHAAQAPGASSDTTRTGDTR